MEAERASNCSHQSWTRVLEVMSSSVIGPVSWSSSAIAYGKESGAIDECECFADNSLLLLCETIKRMSSRSLFWEYMNKM